MTSTQEIADPRLKPPDDDDRVAHYVRKDDIVRANVEGVPVRALCGKTWIPNRDPKGLPVCPICKRIMDNVRNRGSN
ncbi:MAG: DUF3039 domain-containing protein [Acidimicrobiia bacterium]|nr:DUF3039 domain-containing protein [Acidimicrobiia bacterium]MBT8249789.1 DUF3039 domain-containing protein [Acidimicrobiia bacterium]NNL27959.1 DUF3039 domain-containing protein [Acidimicrobiia bacterium]NNL48169.1 DUF3039 domain-containing protein [Acidimicrobiia bacterium]